MFSQFIDQMRQSLDLLGESASRIPGEVLTIGCALAILVGFGGALFTQVKNRARSETAMRVPALFTVLVYGGVTLLMLGTLTSHSRVTGSDLLWGAVVFVCGLVLLAGWSMWANARLLRIEKGSERQDHA